MRAPEALSMGQKEPRIGTVSSFKNFPPKQHLHERRSGLLGAAERLIDQLHSQGKLTRPRRENRKIRHKNEISKANERLHKV
jgi:hypothetical protein